MKYTKEQLDCMHNDEVSKLLCASLGFNVQNFVFEGVVTIEQVGKVSTFDMMDWNDIMPLAVEYGVTLKRVACPAGSGFAHYAESYCGLYHTEYMEPPQRAIACCLILVLQEQ
jgi:hypothetical protein